MKNQIASVPIESPKLKEMADQINELHRDVRRRVRTTLEIARDCGRLLNDCKRRVAHGQWQNWLADNFEASADTARIYMKIAKSWGVIEPQLDDMRIPTITGAIQILSNPRLEDLCMAEESVRDAQIKSMISMIKEETRAMRADAVSVLAEHWPDFWDGIGWWLNGKMGIRDPYPPKYYVLKCEDEWDVSEEERIAYEHDLDMASAST